MSPSAASSPAGHYRWVSCALLFFATPINYIDRQILNLITLAIHHLLAPRFGQTALRSL